MNAPIWKIAAYKVFGMINRENGAGRTTWSRIWMSRLQNGYMPIYIAKKVISGMRIIGIAGPD